MDPETDSDGQGDSYFVEEYFFGGECGLKIRIDDDKELYAKIYESKCMSMKYINKYGVSFDCRNVMHTVK